MCSRLFPPRVGVEHTYPLSIIQNADEEDKGDDARMALQDVNIFF
jgi:hypothetical protein